MKVLIVGGGSGGHIVPALAVAAELHKLNPSNQIDYVIGNDDLLADIVRDHHAIKDIHRVYSGKFRRYHGEGLKQFLDIPTLLKNIRDLFYVIIGIVQALFLVRKLQPDVIFIKGGKVGVPIGLAAALLRIPYVTHDSDAIPGLANRLIARWAAAHAVAMPKELYAYPSNKTFEVGIPISKVYTTITAALQKEYKTSFGIPAGSEVLLVTGGGLGAQRLNMAVAKISKKLMARHPKLAILHIAGKGKEEELSEVYRKQVNDHDLDRIIVEPFVTDLYRYSGAADVIISRAGASTMAEFAVQAKACIIVPNNQLTGGHQTKNAEILADKKAIVNLSDESVQKNPELLLQQIELLLGNPHRRLELARNLHSTSDTNAAHKLALLVSKNAKSQVGDPS